MIALAERVCLARLTLLGLQLSLYHWVELGPVSVVLRASQPLAHHRPSLVPYAGPLTSKTHLAVTIPVSHRCPLAAAGKQRGQASQS